MNCMEKNKLNKNLKSGRCVQSILWLLTIRDGHVPNIVRSVTETIVFQVCSTILKSFFFFRFQKTIIFFNFSKRIYSVCISFVYIWTTSSFTKILFVLKNFLRSKNTMPLFTHHSFDIIQVKLKIEVVFILLWRFRTSFFVNNTWFNFCERIS